MAFPDMAGIHDANTPLSGPTPEAMALRRFEKERLEWAIATAPNSPHLWQHRYKGTPLQILIEHARKGIYEQ